MKSSDQLALSIYSSKYFSSRLRIARFRQKVSNFLFRVERKFDTRRKDIRNTNFNFEKYANVIDLEIVIPVYGPSDIIVESLKSIEQSVGINPKVIIVDNGIPEELEQQIKSFEIVVQYIKNNENKGFGGACDIGISQTSGHYAAILNSDIIVMADTLRKITDLILSDRKVGISSAVLVDERGRYEEFGRVLNPSGDAIPIRGTQRFNKKHHQGNLSVVHASFACIALRTDILRELEGFDAIFWPAYSEDVDVAIRFFEAGYPTVVSGEAIAIHYQGNSSTHIDDLDKIKASNSKKLIHKHAKYFREIETTEDHQVYKYRLNRAWASNRNSTLIVTQNPSLSLDAICVYLGISDHEIFTSFLRVICFDSKSQKFISFSSSTATSLRECSIDYYEPSDRRFIEWIAELICCFDEIVVDGELGDIENYKLLDPILKSQPKAIIRYNR